MHWTSVEINPAKNKIYLVLGFDKMHYLARFTKRLKWHSFTHFVGLIQCDSTWGRSIQVRGWIDLDQIKEISHEYKSYSPKKMKVERGRE